MAFDISTAKPEKNRFDISTAKAVSLNLDVPGPEQDAAAAAYYAGKQKAAGPTITDYINKIPEYAVGLPDAALSAVSAGTTGFLGQVAGTLQQAGKEIAAGQYGTQDAANRIEQRAADVGSSATYTPRTQAGKNILSALGEAAEPLAGIAPLSAELNMINQSARTALPAARQQISSLPNQAVSMISKPSEMSGKSIGSAQVDEASRRRELAAQLPVDPLLTEGQATRDVNQLRFEGETMKGELGTPLRERSAYQHQAIKQSIDEWIDQTGSQGSDLRSVGIAIDSALKQRSIADKARIREAYKKAEEAGETREPIMTDSIVESINNSRSAESTAPVISAAKKEILRLGGAIEAEDGSLIPKEMSLGDAEQLRKFINDNTGYDGPNLAYSAKIKSAIDGTTQISGGDLYRKARRLRENYARQYEDRAVVSDLLETKKGSADRKVALEDIFDRVVFRGSLDDARFIRKSLQTSGDQGKQAWKEIQGAGLRYLRDEATKNVARDSFGNEMISPAALNRAVNRLDADGKLDFIYGKKGAQQIRDLNDISRDLFTAPPGTINHSNTASVLLAALDIGISGTSGVPLPIASGLRIASNKIKDRKIKARVQKALGKYEDNEDK